MPYRKKDRVEVYYGFMCKTCGWEQILNSAIASDAVRVESNFLLCRCDDIDKNHEFVKITKVNGGVVTGAHFS